MAESIANFTTFQSRPSLFEVIAQQTLNETLYPAFQQTIEFLTTVFPRQFQFVYNHHEGAFIILNSFLQYYHLKYYNSSFSENCYNLERVIGNGNGLTQRERELSFITLVIIPFIKRKIEEKLQQYRIEYAEGCIQKDIGGQTKKVLIFSHTVFQIIWGLMHIHYYLRYMALDTKYQLPSLHMLNMKLCYSYELPAPSLWEILFSRKLVLSELSFDIVRRTLGNIFEVTAFFIHFLESWNAKMPKNNMTDLPKVQVPLYDSSGKTYQGKCPICKLKWNNPSVIPVSGYIFCFPCVYKYLSENQKCPVTNLPAKPLDIIRLYNSD
ncbi:peroxisome assembly protein 12 [Sitophilus oryzae]|uniref:Peroxisome assembly protein 12 n=1 Tax=Sitophilus oryzae TaxID=7048 RepID=A0A6J2YPP0_SITOR|nr:peroxisome assembly protein 12 [Sitophilus oryzae]